MKGVEKSQFGRLERKLSTLSTPSNGIMFLSCRYKELVKQGKYVSRSARASLLSGYSAHHRPTPGTITEGVETGTAAAAGDGTELGDDIAGRLAAGAIAGSSRLDVRFVFSSRLFITSVISSVAGSSRLDVRSVFQVVYILSQLFL